MPKTVISIEHLSKCYRLGVIGTGYAFADLKRWWAKQWGKPDPYRKIGSTDHGNREGETVWALKDINFTVEEGEALGIIGRNGAGKSTLLKILSQVTAPTEGVVKVKGRIASLLEVGTGFHSELTGRENIYLNGAINGMSRAEVKRKLDEIVDFSGVEKYIDTPVKRYSSGMYVRLAFAVAAHLDPDILIVDEVLAVGDAEFQKKCLGKMDDVAHAGRTVLFVSHNMAAVRNLCTKGMLLERGQIKSSGVIENAINEYLSHSGDDQTEGSLALRKDRDGDGSVRAIGIKIKNLDQADGLPATGAPTEFLIEYTSQDIKLINKLFVGITISDMYGMNLFTCSTGMKSDFFDAPINGRVICQIGYLPLIPGRYSFNIKITCNNNLADFIINAGSFDVTDSGKGGFLNYSGLSWGSMAVPHEWRLEKNE